MMESTQQPEQQSSAIPMAVPKRYPKRIEIHANEEELGTAEGEEELIADEVEESKPLPNPVLPNQAEVDRHWIDHLPFRSWCGACISGRGRAIPHKRTEGKRKIPTLAFDYCFINTSGVYSREEWANMKTSATEEIEGVNIIVAR